MKKFLGVDNCSSLPLSIMKHDSFSLSELFSKMANLAGDLSNTDLKETGTIKQLIGRDTIQAKRKFLKDLNFVNYAKLVFAANELPRVYDTTDGFWTKWVLLEFPYKFITQKEYDTLPEEERKMKKILDSDIIKKISTPDEMSGLLNKVLDKLSILLKNEEFSYSKGTSEVKELWIRQSDSFTAFCLDNIEEDNYGIITKSDLRKSYFNYCKEHNIKGCSDKSIKITLQNKYGAEENRNKINDNQIYVWEGISFKS